MALKVKWIKRNIVLSENAALFPFSYAPKGTMKKNMLYTFLNLFYKLPNFLSGLFFEEVDDFELYHYYCLNDFLDFVGRMKGCDLEFILYVEGSDSWRQRSYIWCRDEKNIVYFVKVGKGMANSKLFSNDCQMSQIFAAEVKAASESVKIVISEYFAITNKLSCVISDCISPEGNLLPSTAPESIIQVLESVSKKFTHNQVFEVFSPYFGWISDLDGYATDYLKANEGNNVRLSICHGDLGSENILKSSTGEVFLIDFECSSRNAPYLVDRIANDLNINKKSSVSKLITTFTGCNKFDVMLSLLYLKSKGFPPADKVLREYFK